MIVCYFQQRRFCLGDRAIEQSKIKHIVNIRVALANQLKSGDLSIKPTNIEEANTASGAADSGQSFCRLLVLYRRKCRKFSPQVVKDVSRR
jgi:hypothetical protein